MTQEDLGREPFVNFRKTLEKIVRFRYMNENQQEIRNNIEDLINQLLLIKERDKS